MEQNLIKVENSCGVAPEGISYFDPGNDPNFVFANDIPKLEYLTALDKFILLSYIFCCIPTFMSIWFSRLYKIKQAKIAKVNSKIRIYGGIVYLVLIMQIFYI